MFLAAGALGAALLGPPTAARGGKPAGKPETRLEVSHDVAALPERVQAMREAILEAARSGEVENLVPVLQSNELMPMLDYRRVEDAAAFLRQRSADGTGRDILALLIDILEAGHAKVTAGGAVTYVWPWFAEAPLDALTPPQQVELHRVVPAGEVEAMRKAGKYTHYSLGIGPDGTWHYFVRGR